MNNETANNESAKLAQSAVRRGMTDDQIENTFSYHRPFGDQQDRYEHIRFRAREFATMLQAYCPESREKSLAMTNLQQTVMWANAAIAINEKELEAK